MNPVVHFELPASDRKRMADFYTKAFGWKIELLGQESNNYVLATTTEIDDVSCRPVVPGRINGGFYKKSADMPGQHPSVVIAVSNIQEAMAQIVEAGGTILGEPMDIPGVGQYVSFFDTENNRLSVLQPLMPR